MTLEPYESLVEKLPYLDAKQLADIISQSDNWLLSPYQEGVFYCFDQAREYIDNNPNAPVVLCAFHQEDHVRQDILISHDGHQFVLDGSMAMPEQKERYIFNIKSFDDIINVATSLFGEMTRGLFIDDHQIDFSIEPYQNKVKQ